MACGHEHNQKDICPGENLLSYRADFLSSFLSLVSSLPHLCSIPSIMFNIPFLFSPLAVRLMLVFSSEDTPLRAVKTELPRGLHIKTKKEGEAGRDGLACICSLPSSHPNFDNYSALFFFLSLSHPPLTHGLVLIAGKHGSTENPAD